MASGGESRGLSLGQPAFLPDPEEDPLREAATRLSEGEERELIRRAKAGDGGARDLLWEAFFVFALAECRKQARLTKLAADLAEGEAAFAIPETIRRFDLRRHVRFSTYWPTGCGAPSRRRREKNFAHRFLIRLSIARRWRRSRPSGARPSRARLVISGRRR